jgi:hypothetical protein
MSSRGHEWTSDGSDTQTHHTTKYLSEIGTSTGMNDEAVHSLDTDTYISELNLIIHG